MHSVNDKTLFSVILKIDSSLFISSHFFFICFLGFFSLALLSVALQSNLMYSC